MIALLSLPGLALANATAEFNEEPIVVFKKETHLDFELFDVKGQLIKPSGTIVIERQKAIFNPLLKLRGHFNSELMNSINTIR